MELNLKPFNASQKALIEKGADARKEFIRQMMLSFNLPGYNSDFASFIVGPPGIGKTKTVEKVAKENGIRLNRIHGNMSLNWLAMHLAVYAYLSKGEVVYFWFDDTDSLFKPSTMRVLTGMLDHTQLFSYKVNVSDQIRRYRNSPIPDDQVIYDALMHYKISGDVGVSIPVNNMRFIITTNHPLPPEEEYKKRPSRIGEIKNALRSRVNYSEFYQTGYDKWGWAAALALSVPVKTLDDKQKVILLKWMYDNWPRLKQKDPRVVWKLAEEMLRHQVNYSSYWEKRLKDLKDL